MTARFCIEKVLTKGGTLRACGQYLIDQGYDVRILDLINLDRSHCYNPFVYLESDDDIQRLTTNIIKNTTPKGSHTSEPFWDQAAEMLLKALVFYLFYEAPPDEQNFPMVMDLIRAGDVKENDDDYVSPLDILFAELEQKDPEHIALKYYRNYHSGAAQTLKSIQISLGQDVAITVMVIAIATMRIAMVQHVAMLIT